MASGSDDLSDFWNSEAAKNYGAPVKGWEAESKAYDDAGGYGVGNVAMKTPGITKATVGAFMDTSQGDAFRKRLQADLAAIKARTAPQAGKSSIGAAGRMTAATMGPAHAYGGAKVDLAADAAVRAKQKSLMSFYEGVADGTGPSIGGEQLKANTASALAAQQSGAVSGGAGMSPAMRMRAMMASKAATEQAAVGEAAAIKAQEQLGANTALASLYSSARGADATGAAASADFANKASMFNANANNANKFANAGFMQDASMFNAGAAQTQADMDQDLALANAEAWMRSQGMNDAAISARLGFMQDQINKDKADRMAFWGHVAGNDKFDQNLQWQKDQQDMLMTGRGWAAAGEAAGGLATAYGSSSANGTSQQPSNAWGRQGETAGGTGWSPPYSPPSGGTYSENNMYGGRPTSDRRAKSGIRSASPAVARFLDDLVAMKEGC